jgi:hypothetical protein
MYRSTLRSVVSFIPGRFIAGERARNTFDRRVSGPQGRFGRRGEEKILTVLGLELRPLGRPARSQSLYRLQYPGSII